MEELNIQKVLIKEQKQLMQTELKSKREELTEKISQIFDKKKFDKSYIIHHDHYLYLMFQKLL